MTTSARTAIVLAWMVLGHYSASGNEEKAAALKKKETMENRQPQELKQYILLVYLPLAYTPAHATEVREQWNMLTDKWKADGTFVASYVYPGQGYTVNEGGKVLKEMLATPIHKLVSSIIVRAADDEAALALAQACPVLVQGGTIEVREVQQRPAVPAPKKN